MFLPTFSRFSECIFVNYLHKMYKNKEIHKNSLEMFFQVLQDFPDATSHVTLDYLFDLMPVLQPRAFSIASAQKVGCVWKGNIK